jgi:DNA-binding MarR family transcriptional regulator
MSSSSKTALARDVWAKMFGFLMRTSPERARGLGRRGLTPNDARALGTLEPDEGKTMRSLAEAWGCDASNATWIVDRLERLGLAERREVPHDRRIRLVVLTAKGRKIHAELMDEFRTPPSELADMDRDDLEALQQALIKLPSPPLAVRSRVNRESPVRRMPRQQRQRRSS